MRKRDKAKQSIYVNTYMQKLKAAGVYRKVFYVSERESRSLVAHLNVIRGGKSLSDIIKENKEF